MARRNHLDDFTRGRMIGKLKEGRTVTSVAAEFGINKSVVSRAWKAFQTTVVQRAQKLDNCQWSRVLFTDESRFSTRSDSQRVLIWREIGTRFYTSNIGSVIGDRYCEEVLLPHVHLFQGAIGPDFIFMDDNARPHRTLAVEELLESEDITRMDWPAYSPYLNPIEHVWDALGRRIAARLHHPENTQQLRLLN
ncbi:transposable element Tcb2 transposase [Trichonephila clavipes]|nr:transposable element Tcb2 transposase [Trichonephila clavipes]